MTRWRVAIGTVGLLWAAVIVSLGLAQYGTCEDLMDCGPEEANWATTVYGIGVVMGAPVAFLATVLLAIAEVDRRLQRWKARRRKR